MGLFLFSEQFGYHLLVKKVALASALIMGIVVTVLVIAGAPGVDAAEPLKNLKIYPKGTTKKAIKKDMKKMARALGVKCDHCHKRGDMAAETDEKRESRKFMKLTKSLNEGELKDYGRITCDTCHRGKKTPSK